MPGLPRSEWYELTRDLNWDPSYVDPDEIWPAEMSNAYGVPAHDWWSWDEPYKLTYPEYVHNQSAKEQAVYAVNSVVSRSSLYDELDPCWKAVIIAHYGAIAVPEYTAGIGEARMARFGRAAAWRNMAMFGTLDETRHGQIQTSFAHSLLPKDPRADWAHKAMHTNEWGAIAARHIFDDMFTANDAVSTAIQLTLCFETGFSNLQFLGMAADAMGVGDIDFSSLISSIQTDEARHAQQGEPTVRILLEHGNKDVVQKLIDHMFWRSWHLFALLTGASMDYYTPLANRKHSFKEFMNEWIVRQFLDQFRDLGLEPPWYFEEHFLPEMDWYHHATHLGVWFWRPTVWWNPAAGAGPAEREWLEEKYPGWNDTFGRYWDVIGANVRAGHLERTGPETFPMVCNMCQIPLCTPAGFMAGKLDSPEPKRVVLDGRAYFFCSEPCKWIFEQSPARFKGHLSIIDRFLGGVIQPPTIEGALAYMGLSPEEMGQDATNFAWAGDPVPAAV